MIYGVLGTETLQNEISYTGNEGLSTPSPPCRSQNLEKSVSLGLNGKSKPTTSVMITVTEKIYENHSRRSLAGSFGERFWSSPIWRLTHV